MKKLISYFLLLFFSYSILSCESCGCQKKEYVITMYVGDKTETITLKDVSGSFIGDGWVRFDKENGEKLYIYGSMKIIEIPIKEKERKNIE